MIRTAGRNRGGAPASTDAGAQVIAVRRLGTAPGVLCGLLAAAMLIFPAVSPASVPEFVNLSSNHITSSDSVRMAVRRGVEQAVREERPFTILHIGDSHLQAGYFTGVVRDSLQSLMGSAGRGFVAPLSIAGSNQPADYRISSPEDWTSRRASLGGTTEAGLGGYTITRTGGDSTLHFFISSRGREFDRVRVFLHPEAPALEAPEELSGGISCPQEGGVLDIFLSRPTDTLTLTGRLTPQYPRGEYYGFSLERDCTGLLYHVVGVNGMNCNHLLNNRAIIDNSDAFTPDVVIVSLGTNESCGGNFNPDYLRARFRAILERIKVRNPGTVIVLTTPMEFARRYRYKGRTRYAVNPNVARTRSMIISLGEECGVPVWDFYSVAGGPGANARWNTAGLVRPDRLHLDVDGYELQGRLFFRALAEFMDLRGIGSERMAAAVAK